MILFNFRWLNVTDDLKQSMINPILDNNLKALISGHTIKVVEIRDQEANILGHIEPNNSIVYVSNVVKLYPNAKQLFLLNEAGSLMEYDL